MKYRLNCIVVCREGAPCLLGLGSCLGNPVFSRIQESPVDPPAGPPNRAWDRHDSSTSVEDAGYTSRVRHLQKINAAVRFLSVEPLLGPIARLPLSRIDWVIVGGESGPGAREMKPEWVRQIRDRCLGRQVPFFFKQWGGVNKKKTGRVLDGRRWDEMPQDKEDLLYAQSQ